MKSSMEFLTNKPLIMLPLPLSASGSPSKTIIMPTKRLPRMRHASADANPSLSPCSLKQQMQLR